MAIILTKKEVNDFEKKLRAEERGAQTVEKYVKCITVYAEFLKGRVANKSTAIEWKKALIDKGFAPQTINGYLAAVNKFFSFKNHSDWRIKYLVVSKKLFREDNRDLTRKEYLKIIEALKKNPKTQKLLLLVQTICSTGIRVSELKYITLENAIKGTAEISLKGKIRTILLPAALSKQLIAYAKEKNITSGEIFITRNKNPMDRRHIWRELKKASKYAGIETSKVYPHNLRHLFAKTFYDKCHDLVRLSDVLGHSSIDTTRIYLISTGKEHRTTLDKLSLVS